MLSVSYIIVLPNASGYKVYSMNILFIRVIPQTFLKNKTGNQWYNTFDRPFIGIILHELIKIVLIICNNRNS